MFEDETEILGTPRAYFHMMPDVPAYQVCVEVYDVGPGDRAALITRGQYGTRTAEPGRHTQVEIELRTIGYVVARGHHLRLDISNYDTTYAFPYFEPSVARLYHDNRNASRVEIPTRNSV